MVGGAVFDAGDSGAFVEEEGRSVDRDEVGWWVAIVSEFPIRTLAHSLCTIVTWNPSMPWNPANAADNPMLFTTPSPHPIQKPAQNNSNSSLITEPSPARE